MDHEREALLELKAGMLVDLSNSSASWSGNECCNWKGIRCNNQTGSVVALDLGNFGLFCNLSLSLFNLSNLEYLDLSNSDLYRGLEIFTIGTFHKLKYLNLSRTYMSPVLLPPQLGNMTQLEYLDLSFGDTAASADISWLSHLQSLRYLDMSWVNLQQSKEWVQALNKLPSLEVLILAYNYLTYIPQSIPHVNFTSLRTLHLTLQQFNTTIPSWIFSLHQLTDLNLARSEFVGPFTVDLGNLTSLTELVLDVNFLYGKVPSLYNLTKLTYLSLLNIPLGENITEIYNSLSRESRRRLEALILQNCNLKGTLTGWIGEMSNLRYLDLSINNLTGTIPDEIGNLQNLVELDLAHNSFTGSITSAHLHHLSELKVLRMEYNLISIAPESKWQPTFKLQTLSLSSTKAGPKFPIWLQNQVHIENLALSNCQISDIIPNWLWNFKSLSVLHLDMNKIRGVLPERLGNLANLTELMLNSNQLEGKIPSHFPNNLQSVDLSDNRFQQLPKTLQGPNLATFFLSNNNLSGNIQFSLCNLTRLGFLDLSRNNLSGYLPSCSLPSLQEIDISNNNLVGTIPRSLCNARFINVLMANNNYLSGNFPSALQFCKELVLIDIGENKFYGEVPDWIGESLTQLQFLRLRTNSFSGNIPSKVMQLNNLIILDLADNLFSGSIPTHLENLTMMHDQNSSSTIVPLPSEGWPVTMKGINLMYKYFILYLRSIDLSNNNLSGQIPETIAVLDGLTNLNLSHNHLEGRIPTKIGMIKSLESLDFRMNDLSGTIPESMSDLSYLEVLNVSYNNLSGSIPKGTQLQTFDPFVYVGNQYLCGPPLQTSCSTDGSSPHSNNNSSSNSNNSSQKAKLVKV